MKLAALFLSLALASAPARGDPSSPSDASWYVDGGAIPLLYVPVVTQLAIDHWIAPRATPLGFDPHEGGARHATSGIPDWTLYVAGAATGAAFVAGGNASRWYHVKGLAEAMATSSFAMSVMKHAFGRHRPDWTAVDDDALKNQSFPSGHAVESFAIATYAALYVHDHAPAIARPFVYGGAFAAALAISAERVYHHRHHVTDVVVGALLGATTAALIYWYQDRQAASANVGAAGRTAALSFGGAF